MKWHFKNDSPIYSQIVEQIKAGIITGDFPAGEKLPSVRDMASEAGVNPNTMQRAMAELEREGLVHSQRTSGRLVTDDESIISQAKRSLAIRHVEEFLSAMGALGFSREDTVQLLLKTTESEAEK